MKIYQLLPTLFYGDGVGNDCFAIKQALKNNGYETEIYAEEIDKRLPVGVAKSICQLPKINEDDIILYHLSVGTDLNLKMLEMSGKKIVKYHNITPPEFFERYNINTYNACKRGYEETKKIAENIHYLLADSSYNRNQMIDMGFEGVSEVVPILIPFNDYDSAPDQDTINELKKKNGSKILFVGRVAPNKRHERLLEVFYFYKKYYDRDAELFLVGYNEWRGQYEKELELFSRKLKLKDVHFTGKLPFNKILAYYRSADTFLCMSDHEGFCIPLLESMHFDKPVIALDTTAVSDTLGGSGVLVKKYDPLEIAGLIHKVNTDSELRNKILMTQRERLKDFDQQIVTNKLINFIQQVERD